MSLFTDSAQAPNLAVLYSNRAMCYIKIGDNNSCIADCGKSLELAPGNHKALLRRAKAYEDKEK